MFLVKYCWVVLLLTEKQVGGPKTIRFRIDSAHHECCPLTAWNRRGTEWKHYNKSRWDPGSELSSLFLFYTGCFTSRRSSTRKSHAWVLEIAWCTNAQAGRRNKERRGIRLRELQHNSTKPAKTDNNKAKEKGKIQQPPDSLAVADWVGSKAACDAEWRCQLPPIVWPSGINKWPIGSVHSSSARRRCSRNNAHSVQRGGQPR